MKRVFRLFKIATLALTVAYMASCGKQGNPSATNPGDASTTTGIEYNTDDGFQVNDFAGQPEGPNLVFVEGGRFTMGSFEEDLMQTRDNMERTVTVASFYMDMTEVANIHWLEYLFFVSKDSAAEYAVSQLPDTTVWASQLAFNDPYVDHYLRYPGFRYFPVVGITWLQANNYAAWRTAKVNERLAKDAGIEVSATDGGRIPLESGVVLPNYRLPTEAEWEYAAQALIGLQFMDENYSERRLYPWSGHALRNPHGAQMGFFLANFKRGRGDYAGIAGRLNDGAMITTDIYQFPPNDFGLYNMAGNVNEWVWDVYRPISYQTFDDLNPIRRNGYLDEEKSYNSKNFESLIDDHVRVYKGGSWKDVAYWLAPGTRRFLAEDSCTSTIGFRCAMIRAGSNY